MDKCAGRRGRVHIQKARAHVGVNGNERADELAKRAAQSRLGEGEGGDAGPVGHKDDIPGDGPHGQFHLAAPSELVGIEEGAVTLEVVYDPVETAPKVATQVRAKKAVDGSKRMRGWQEARTQGGGALLAVSNSFIDSASVAEADRRHALK